jgi:GNAT superfamily N-acetyltransferase
MTEFTIRPAIYADVPALAGLLRNFGYFPRLENEPLERTREMVTAQLERAIAGDAHTVLVAADQNEHLLGYAAVHWLPYLFLPGPEGYVSEIFVHKDLRGQGAGRALLDAVIAEARSRGCCRLQLINVRNRESYARGFYAKNGWEERPDAASFTLYLE